MTALNSRAISRADGGHTVVAMETVRFGGQVVAKAVDADSPVGVFLLRKLQHSGEPAVLSFRFAGRYPGS